jgi:DNA-binding protein YbaB
VNELKVQADKEINEMLEKIRFERWHRSAALLSQWLLEIAKKKAVPDLADRIEKFSKRIYAMCEDMRLEYSNGTYVVKVRGTGEQTLKMLRLGTDWFEPNDDVVKYIIAGLDEEFGS